MDQLKSKTAYLSKQPLKILPLYTAKWRERRGKGRVEGGTEGEMQFSLFTHSHTKVN